MRVVIERRTRGFLVIGQTPFESSDWGESLGFREGDDKSKREINWYMSRYVYTGRKWGGRYPDNLYISTT